MTDGIQEIGRLLVILGIGAIVIGGILLFSEKLPWLGKLPGDILVRKKNFTFYFPLATSILLSLLLTLVFFLLRRK